MDCLVYGNNLDLGAPTGFVLQLTIFSTWGDPYYVGLTGVELYDTAMKLIPVTESSMYSYIVHTYAHTYYYLHVDDPTSIFNWKLAIVYFY